MFKLGTDGHAHVQLSNKTGFEPFADWGPLASTNILNSLFDDLNADGKSDYLVIGSGGNLSVANSNGAGFDTRYNWGTVALGDGTSSARYTIADIKGDGNKAVLFIGTDGSQQFTFYNSSTICSGQSCTILGNGDPSRYRYADFNGDGKTDVLYIASNDDLWVALSNGTNFDPAQKWLTFGNGDPTCYLLGDFNGDGLAEILYVAANHDVSVALSSGQRFITPVKWVTYGDGYPANYRSFDMNGDGRSDLIFIENYFKQNIGLSTGEAFLTPAFWGELGVDPRPFNLPETACNRYIDINGDGKRDIHTCNSKTYPGYIGNFEALLSFEGKANLLTGISNGIGGFTQIEYTLFEDYFTHKSIGPLYVVKSIKKYDNSNLVCDVNNVCSWHGAGTPLTTGFNYSGGYYHYGNKEFRGFNYAIVSGPTGSSGEQTITETWFHQGGDTAVDVNTPNATVGFMKGKPYRTRISDNSSPSRIYSETETTYTLKTSSPNYFAPPSQVDTYICDGNATVSCKGNGTARHAIVNYSYDDYGNITREDRYGDVANVANVQLNMTITRSFLPNVSNGNWLISFPASESIYQGIGTSDNGSNLMVSHTDFYYDDLAFDNCNATPTNNQQPNRGNLTRISRWLKGGAPSETRIAYDVSGNPVCSRDPNGNVTATGYDPSFQTFPILNTNAKSQVTTSSFYGVGGAADKGLFGQLKSIADPNNATATLEYDPFGRVTRDIQPDNFWTSTTYDSFGSVGSQNVYSSNQLGMWSAAYFDGLGRTFKMRSSGPDNKVIVVDTVYNERGMLSQVSSPYFEGSETPVYRTYLYDVQGRVVQTTNPDTTSTLDCYSDLVSVHIDENGHKRRETKDPLGRLVTVEEYEGTYTTCDTLPGTPYASTAYSYDVLGNLTGVTDAYQKNTIINYDTLGRKKNMTDPDMGYWQYSYYPDGSPYTVTDAKNQTITYSLDVLNRPTLKHYPAGSGATDVVYAYDETTSSNPKGRLTSMSDGSGQTAYHYDLSGRPTTTVKRIDSTDYTIIKDYDGLGRAKSVTYPDNGRVDYVYDIAGNLQEVTGYAEYDEYNALGQPGKVYYGNGIETSYWYYPQNNRLFAMKTDQLQMSLLYRTYNYDNKGNVSQINDLASPAPQHNITNPNVSYNYWQNRAHALQGDSAHPTKVYLYDDNGNMTADSQRTYTYTPENMPKTITLNGVTTTFTYDGNGKRVKKSTPTSAAVYIDGLYECTNGYCDKHIYGGNGRLAIETASQTFFHHGDHLGSTSVVTDASGNQVKSVAYYPFGETRQEDGVYLNYKYTGQELDNETGLYNYAARLYSPEIGRFITADSIVPDLTNPQSFNRYAYVQNNPVNRIDPSGNIDFEFGGFNICLFGCGDSNSGGGGNSGGNSSFGADYAMSFYQSPSAYDYNSNFNTNSGTAWSNNAWSSNSTIVPWYSGEGSTLSLFKNSVTNALLDRGTDRYSQGYNAAGDLNMIGAALWNTFIPETNGQLMFGAVLGPVSKGSQILKRLGTSNESAVRLARKAADAEEKIGIHGVSTSASPTSNPASQATREAVEKVFQVHNTPTKADPLHMTVELPKPVTNNIADMFNKIFGRKK